MALNLQLVGQRGDRGQSAMHEYDKNTGIIFFSQVSLNGIGCWDTTKPLTESNFHIIAQDNATMVYPSDINVSQNRGQNLDEIHCNPLIAGRFGWLHLDYVKQIAALPLFHA